MADNAGQFWQIVDVFESVDGAMFTVWDHVALQRRTLHTKDNAAAFQIGDLIRYQVADKQVIIRPVERDFRVPEEANLLLPAKEYHRHGKTPVGGYVMYSGDLDSQKMMQRM